MAAAKLFHDEGSNQRAPPMLVMNYIEQVKIVAYGDGWPEYEEAVFEG